MKNINWPGLPNGARRVVTGLVSLTHDVLDRAFQAANTSRGHPQLVTVTGPAGTGKTFSVRWWCEEAADRVENTYVRCYPDTSAFDLSRTLLGAIGLSDKGRGVELMDRLIGALRNRSLLIVLDDADVLRPSALTGLSCLLDEREMCLVLVLVGIGFDPAQGAALGIPARLTGSVEFAPLRGNALVKALREYHALLRHISSKSLKQIDNDHGHGEWRVWRSILIHLQRLRGEDAA